MGIKAAALRDPFELGVGDLRVPGRGGDGRIRQCVDQHFGAGGTQR